MVSAEGLTWNSLRYARPLATNASDSSSCQRTVTCRPSAMMALRSVNRQSCIAGPSSASSLRSPGTIGRREALQMVLGVTEGLRQHRQAPERVADLQLLRHPHAAVELDGLLAHVAAGVGDLDLGGRDHAPTLGGVSGV